jgi:tetratricopeptide (TPR) repeat protein
MLYQEQAQDLYVEGNRRMAADDAAGAEASYLQALELDPLHGAARANLGYLKERLGDLPAAELHYRLALALLPDSAQLHQNLGVLLLKQKRFTDAEAALRAAVAVAPASPAAWRDLGVLLACVQRDAEAEQCYRHALALAGDALAGHGEADTANPQAALLSARTRFNLAYLQMRQGRWAEGWPLLAARWQFEQLKPSIEGQFWQGESLAGKSLLIVQDAGHGDLLQFCRYALLAKEQGAQRVTIYCHPVLKPLLSTMVGIDKVIAFDDGATRERWDYWTLPMSMPQWFNATPDNVPSASYLQADPALAAAWRGRLPADGLRVGLAWKGNPNFENDADRSLPSLHALAPLAAAVSASDVGPALHFVSLQRGAGEEEALDPPHGMALHAIGPQLRDFSYTAAVIANLDLVISVDSAVAHLAGAMGKPVWLLLPDYRCDWRWLTQRSDTPWYPDTRLFRQPSGGDWSGLMPVLADALAQWCVAQPG